MRKTSPAALAAALALVLCAPAAFAEEPVIEPTPTTAADPDPTETGDPIPNEPSTATATALPTSGPRVQPAFADLDTDADGYVTETDLPAEHELSLQFAVADTDQDDRLSQAEFDAYQSAPEEEEAEE
jgi:hypothetical protein